MSPAAPRPALVLINPGASRADADLGPGLARLEAAGLEARLERPAGREALAARIRAAPGEGAGCIVLGGGDGTLHHALEALGDAALPLGILPLGTGNDLARALGLPMDPAEACAVVAAGRTRRIDLVRCGERLFANQASFGMASRVTRRLDAGAKRRLGVLAYPLAAARAVWGARPFRVELEADGAPLRARALQVTVANGPHFGGGMTLDPEATLTDGRLRVCVVGDQDLAALLRLAVRLARGRLREHDHARVVEARRVVARTSRRLAIDADGELSGHTPARFEVLPEALEVFVGVPSRPGGGP